VEADSFRWRDFFFAGGWLATGVDGIGGVNSGVGGWLGAV
jgi:hypothetical protein